ncbi:MAG TPA: FAD-dependent oxidoreductase [Candidatus Acidoferrales bacterium]|nr:FAD-dependent oxidoreductase [Candidatus Acidoferrales bacterium]
MDLISRRVLFLVTRFRGCGQVRFGRDGAGSKCGKFILNANAERGISCSISWMGETIQTQCCIAGGGPAGMMLGFLLARAGVDVQVLEKHADFLRDFRGDTVHPSTLEVMYELGLLGEFLKRPHQEVRELSGQVANEMVPVADLTHLPTHCKFIALMPQWDFLNFIAEQGKRYPGFHLRMQTEVTDLIREDGRVAGVQATTSHGALEVRAGLTIGADGRRSVVRQRAGLEVVNLGAPMDVLWMQISRRDGDSGRTFGHVDAGRIFVMIDRADYWQCAFVIPKGGIEDIRQKGLAAFREEIARLAPFLRDRVDELRDWKNISLLTVVVDRLSRWFLPGLLCIGDAAHAMSPIGGVGINLAIQDAVAASNILARKLRESTVRESDLHAVQQRRMFPTRATQRMQIFVQNRVISRVLSRTKPLGLPWLLKLLRACPFLRRYPARIVGVGFRPEHVKTVEAKSATTK